MAIAAGVMLCGCDIVGVTLPYVTSTNPSLHKSVVTHSHKSAHVLSYHLRTLRLGYRTMICIGGDNTIVISTLGLTE